MKRGSRVPCLALLALTTLGTTAATEGKFQKLTAGQIRAKLAGMELTDNVHWRDLYQRNGTIMSTSMGRKRTGRVSMEKRSSLVDRQPDEIGQINFHREESG